MNPGPITAQDGHQEKKIGVWEKFSGDCYCCADWWWDVEGATCAWGEVGRAGVGEHAERERVGPGWGAGGRYDCCFDQERRVLGEGYNVASVITYRRWEQYWTVRHYGRELSSELNHHSFHVADALDCCNERRVSSLVTVTPAGVIERVYPGKHLVEPAATVTGFAARSGRERESIEAARKTSRRSLSVFIGFTCDSGSMFHVLLHI